MLHATLSIEKKSRNKIRQYDTTVTTDGDQLNNKVVTPTYTTRASDIATKLECLFPDLFMGRAEDTGGPRYLSPSPLLCVAKIKKENKGKKERDSKHKLLKGCHQGQNVTVLAILERLEFKNVSYWPTIVADNIFQCFMFPPL